MIDENNHKKLYTKGLVSVIIPTYKRCEMLLRAVNSVLDQTYSNIEILIVNDNDKDDEFSERLRELLREHLDAGTIVLIEQEKHINGAVARNVGIKKASGEFIAFLDDDDYWEKNKIEEQIKALNNCGEEYGAVSCLKKYYNQENLIRASLPYKDGDVFKSVLCCLTNITTGTILVKHEALDVSGYFNESLKRQQDVQLFAYLSNKYKIKLVKKHLLNIDVSSTINRPNLDDYFNIKSKYIESVLPLIDDKSYIKLKRHFDFSYGVELLKGHHRIKGVAKVLKYIFHPTILFAQLHYYFKNIREVIFKKAIIRKYDKH